MTLVVVSRVQVDRRMLNTSNLNTFGSVAVLSCEGALILLRKTQLSTMLYLVTAVH